MSGASLTHKPARREIELDFIRGIAILLVLDFHAPVPFLTAPLVWMGIPAFGIVGVDVFFVLSGFLVGGLLVKEWKLRGRINSGRFLIRRGMKIWPQYYVFLAAAAISGRHSAHALWGNWLNIQNYTGGIAHTWSLAVEEHAYLLLVAALALAASLHLRMKTLFLCVAAVVAGVVCWRTVLVLHGMYPFTRTDTRIDGILCGLLLAMLYHYWPQRFLRLQNLRWLWWSYLPAFLLYMRFKPDNAWSAAVTYMTATMLGIVLMLLLYRRRAEEKQRPWLYRAVAWIGLYSYGIYLWHVSPMAQIISLAGRTHGWAGTLLLTVGPPIAGIVLGVVTTKLVEFPMLTVRDKLFPRQVDSAVGTPAEVEAQTGKEFAPESVSAG